MAKNLFKPGNNANPKGRPKGSGYRQAMEKALKEYGEKRFWRETFEKARTEPAIRIALIKKLVPDMIDVTEKPLLVMNE